MEIPPPSDIESEIHKSVIGQERAIEKLAKAYVRIRSGIRSSSGGVLDSIFLAGPSGVGKTKSVLKLVEMLIATLPDKNFSLPTPEKPKIEAKVNGLKRKNLEDDFKFFKRRDKLKANLTKAAIDKEKERRLATGKKLFTDRDILSKIIKIDGGSFQLEHEIATILGSPHGYIGFRQNRGLLHQEELGKYQIKFKDFNGNEREVIFVLLDEAEKGHETLHDAFLTILDKGHLTLGDNSISDLSNAVIFFTSNVGNVEAEKSREHALGFKREEQIPEKSFWRAFKGIFKPEYRGRINRTIVFEHLKPEHLSPILNLCLQKIENLLREQNIRLTLEVTPATREFFVEKGYNLSEGARALEKIVDLEIFDQLVLATRQYDLDRTTVVVDVERGKSTFYLSDNQPQRRAKRGKVTRAGS